MCKCLMEPHWYRFCCFRFDFSSWFLLVSDCFVHVDETFSKAHSWTLIHPTSPTKYVTIYFIFCNYLVVEGSHYYYIVLLIVWFVFISDDCSIEKNRLKAGLILISINWKLYLSIYWTHIWRFQPHNRSYCLGSCYAPSSWFFSQRMKLHCSSIHSFVCQTCV